MLFNSLTYLLFLTLAVPLYWLVPRQGWRGYLFVASMVFYCSWKWQYGFVFLGSIALNFYLGRWVHGKTSIAARALPVVANLLLLGYFKYLGFFTQTIDDLSALISGTRPLPIITVVLPLGISFFTFQGMSYAIDIARGKRAPEPHLTDYALYVAFWPHLIAGPIVRSHELIPQLRARPPFDSERFAIGLKRIFYGLFLKVVLADNISPFVDEGFSIANYTKNTALDNWTLAFAFGLQIYFDFAGYSSVAIGSADLLGIVLPENFDFPYVANSPREFWQRWHITLSSWIRDYLYIPLQGAVAGPSRSGGGIGVEGAKSARSRNVAVLITWMLMGLWHGANWTFVAWGLWHAGIILAYRSVSAAWPSRGRWSALGTMITVALVMPSWIFFRAGTLRQAFTMLAAMARPSGYVHMSYKENFYLITFCYLAAFYGAYGVNRWLTRERSTGGALSRYAFLTSRGVVYASVVILVLGFLRGHQQFIYFQF
jgi:D-alanyl-lipoteichoic acid acyltransferase DltB (MBOAT superfamily)